MATLEPPAQKWTRRAGDAAVEAVCEGASAEEIREAVEAGIREGMRVAALRRGETPPTDPAPARPARPAEVNPGGALARLLGLAR